MRERGLAVFATSQQENLEILISMKKGA